MRITRAATNRLASKQETITNKRTNKQTNKQQNRNLFYPVLSATYCGTTVQYVNCFQDGKLEALFQDNPNR